MKRKKYELSARAKRASKNDRHISDSQIDFSDIPESSDEELRQARRVGRPTDGDAPKQLIAFRIDPNLLAKIKKLAAKAKLPYQTFIHKLLESKIH